MHFIKKSEEIYYVNELPVFMKKNDLNCVNASAQKSFRNRSRVCTHLNKSAIVHEMMLSYTKNTYIRPMRQENNIVSFHIIEGEALLYLFDDTGLIQRIVKMGAYTSGLPFYFRESTEVYRTMIALSPHLLFHEITEGPFVEGGTLFSPWAPKEEEISLAADYINNLLDVARKRNII